MRRGARSNKALHLPSNSAFQLWFGSLLASTLGARAASEALLAVAERPSARPREKKARPMFDPKEFVRFCQAALGGPDPSAMIHAELLRIVAQPGEIEPPPAGDRTAWQLLRSPRLTVLHTRYPRSLRTPAHNHGAWAVVSVYRGREDNVRYVRDGANIREVARQSLHPGDAVVLESTEIHDLATSSDRETCSIHVYGVDLYCPDGHSMWVPPSLEERSYDEKEFVRHTTAMTREARGVTAGR